MQRTVNPRSLVRIQGREPIFKVYIMSQSKISKNSSATIGEYGEQLVAIALEKRGHIVKVSKDKYDSEKDMTIDGKRIAEVKTQVIFMTKNALTYQPNQVRKCSSVDDLYFVTYPPPSGKRHMYNGWMIHVDPKKMVTESYKTKDGRDMILIPIDQPAVTLLDRIKEADQKILMAMSLSKY